MAYQMGVKGLMNFKMTLMAIAQKDYKTASTRMLASLWAKQTPKRAQTLATRMANIKG
jgi:lysozyme